MLLKNYINSNIDNFVFGLAKAKQISFQEPANNLMLGIIDLHHQIFYYLIITFVLVSYLLMWAIYDSYAESLVEKNPRPFNFRHCSFIEIIWTVVPAIILYILLLPSLSLLYTLDDFKRPDITLRVIGHQWYWSYDLHSFSSLIYDSNESFLELPNLFDSSLSENPENVYHSFNNDFYRLLEVDNRLILPTYTKIRLLVTSSDVLHSWTIPSFGVKIDACPGRINQVVFEIYKEGIFYGQCSELCGVGHGFMPIVIESCSYTEFLFWGHYLYTSDIFLFQSSIINLEYLFFLAAKTFTSDDIIAPILNKINEMNLVQIINNEEK